MRKRIRRIAIWGLVVVSLLAIAWTSVLMSGKQRLDKELEYWRKQGLEIPIYAGVNVKTDEAGDPRILRVIELYADISESTLELINNPDEADPDALAEAVADCGKVLIAVHEVAAEAQAVWKEPVLESPGWLDDLIVRLSHPRSITRLLDAEALVKSRQGDLEGACDSIVAGFSLGRQVGEHHSMVAVMVESMIVEMMIHRLESIYYRGGVPTQQVVSALKQLDMPDKFVPTLKWEGVYLSRVTTGHVLSPWGMHDTAYALRRYRGKIQHIELHGFPLRRINFHGYHPWWAKQYKLIEPSLKSYQNQLLHIQGRIEMAKCVVQLRQFKIHHGMYPENLDDLDSPGIDPFTGFMFHYEKNEQGFTLYGDLNLGGGGKSMIWEWEE